MLKLVYVPKYAPPKGYTCQVCKKKLKVDEVALMDTFTSEDETHRRAYHKTCLKSFIETEPDTIQEYGSVSVEYARIKQAAMDGNPWA